MSDSKRKAYDPELLFTDSDVERDEDRVKRPKPASLGIRMPVYLGNESVSLKVINATCADVSPDGSLLAVACTDKTTRVFDLPSGNCRFSKDDHIARVVNVCFSLCGAFVYSCCDLGVTRRYDVSTGQTLSAEGRFLKPAGRHSRRYDRDGQEYWLLLDESVLSVIKCFDAKDDEVTKITHPRLVTSAVLSHATQPKLLVMTACQDGCARVFDAASGLLLYKTPPSSAPLLDARFSRDEESAVLTDKDGRVTVLDLTYRRRAIRTILSGRERLPIVLADLTLSYFEHAF